MIFQKNTKVFPFTLQQFHFNLGFINYFELFSSYNRNIEVLVMCCM